jgi:hypothetical protein
MVEFDFNLEPEKSPEEAGEELVAFAEKAEFGTPEFQVLCDSYDLEGLYQTYSSQLKMAENPGTGIYSEFKAVSRVRITETKIALLEHQIEQKQNQVPGYDHALQYMDSLFDVIGNAAADDQGEIEIAVDEDDQTEYPSVSYLNYHKRAREIVYKKRASA